MSVSLANLDGVRPSAGGSHTLLYTKFCYVSVSLSLELRNFLSMKNSLLTQRFTSASATSLRLEIDFRNLRLNGCNKAVAVTPDICQGTIEAVVTTSRDGNRYGPEGVTGMIATILGV